MRNSVFIGGTGLIGSKAVAIPCQGGHEVVAASPKSGVNTIAGEGKRGRHHRPTESSDRFRNTNRQAPSFLLSRAEESMP
jgi:hypothetical protein